MPRRSNHTKQGHVPLTSAARALGKTYNATLRSVLTGKLSGHQDDEGYWWVESIQLKPSAIAPGAPLIEHREPPEDREQ